MDDSVNVAKVLFQTAVEDEYLFQKADSIQIQHLAEEANPEAIFHIDMGENPEENDSSVHIILFDLETTGLRENPAIIEIACHDLISGKKFHSYVKPYKDIEPAASLVNGLFLSDDKIRNAPVIGEVMMLLVNWTDSLKFGGGDLFFFVAHNCEGFDKRIMLNELNESSMSVSWEFWDSLPMLQAKEPNLPSYSLKNLQLRYVPEFTTPLHSAQADVECLYLVMQKIYGLENDEFILEIAKEILDEYDN